MIIYILPYNLLYLIIYIHISVAVGLYDPHSGSRYCIDFYTILFALGLTIAGFQETENVIKDKYPNYTCEDFQIPVGNLAASVSKTEPKSPANHQNNGKYYNCHTKYPPERGVLKDSRT